MPPSSPSDLIWRILAPVVERLELLDPILELFASYGSWCAGGMAGLALLLWAGAVWAHPFDYDDEPSGAIAA